MAAVCPLVGALTLNRCVGNVWVWHILVLAKPCFPSNGADLTNRTLGFKSPILRRMGSLLPSRPRPGSGMCGSARQSLRFAREERIQTSPKMAEATPTATRTSHEYVFMKLLGFTTVFRSGLAGS